MHPRKRIPPSGISRRSFLRTAGVAAAGLPAALAFLSACEKSSTPPSAAPPGITTASRDRPATLPLFQDNPSIPDDLPLEQDAKLHIYGWPQYVAPKLLRGFEERYDCRIVYESFVTMDEAVARLRTGTFTGDVFFPATTVLGALAAARVLQPLNLSYIGNLGSNVWDQLVNPFYDRGPRYSVPYFVWTTGIAWRNDLVSEDIAALDNPYDVFWNPRYRGFVHLLNNPRDTIAMTLLRNGGTNVNETDPAVIRRAREDLFALVDAVAPQFDHTDYRDLFSGDSKVHQSWSGNIGFAHYYSAQQRDVAHLSYLWPPQGRDDIPGIIGNDTMAILAGAMHPVLAHRFLDFMLEETSAYVNSVYEGYQAPVSSVTRDRLMREGAVAPNLRNIIVEPEDFSKGYQELELAPAVDELWQASYAAITAAAANVPA